MLVVFARGSITTAEKCPTDASGHAMVVRGGFYCDLSVSGSGHSATPGCQCSEVASAETYFATAKPVSFAEFNYGCLVKYYRIVSM